MPADVERSNLRRSSGFVWLALSVASLLWVALLATAPLQASRSQRAPLLISALTYAAGAALCHQQPARSFQTAGVRWPVCSRCAGLYVGGTVGLLLGGLLGSRVPQRSTWNRLLATAAVPTLASWTLASAGIVDSSNAVRFGLALPLGAAAGAWLSTALLSRHAVH